MAEGLATTTRWNGSTLTLVRNEEVFDPFAGVSYQQEWIGTKDQVDLKESTSVASGWRTARTVEADQHRLLLNTPDPAIAGGGATETPVDAYELTTEYETTLIWSNPKIVERAHGTSALDTIQVLAKYRRFCDSRLRDLYGMDGQFLTTDEEIEALTDGTINEKVARGMGPTPIEKLHVLSSSGAEEFGTAERAVEINAIYKQLLMGIDGWEVRRVVLGRRRTCSAKYAAQHVVDGVEKVYTTAALKTHFDIPNGLNEIGQRLPNDPPTTPPECQWSWKIRRQDSQQFRGTGRVEEVIDWVFAAWSLMLYDLISS